MYRFNYKTIDFMHISDNIFPVEDGYFKSVHTINVIAYFIYGGVELTVENETKILESGDVIFIKAGKYVAARFTPDVNFDGYIFCFPDAILPNMLVDKLKDLPVFSRQTDELNVYFLGSDRYMNDSRFEDDEKHMIGVAETLRYLTYMRPKESEVSDAKANVVDQISQYVQEHITEKITLSDLSKALNYSEAYMISAFKSKMYCTIKQYIKNKKCIFAYKMIRDGAKPSDVCKELGYEDYSTFYRNYVSVIGYAPTDKNQEYEIVANEH